MDKIPVVTLFVMVVGVHACPPNSCSSILGGNYLCPDGRAPQPPECLCGPCNLRCLPGYRLDVKRCRCQCTIRSCDAGMRFDRRDCQCIPIPCKRPCQPNEKLDLSSCSCIPEEIFCPASLLRRPCPFGRQRDPESCLCVRPPTCDLSPLSCASGMRLDSSQCKCVQIPCDIVCPVAKRLDRDTCRCVQIPCSEEACAPGMFRDPVTCACGVARPCNQSPLACAPGEYLDPDRCRCVPDRFGPRGPPGPQLL